MLNFTAQPARFALPEAVGGTSATLLIANYPVDAGADFREFDLRPYEARVYEVGE